MRQPRRKGVRREPDGLGGSYRIIQLAGETVEEGGWYGGSKWLTGSKVDAAENRWIKQANDAAPKDDHDWCEHQCGGCRYFAALNGDWGICWNKISPMDGRVMFEHVGCEQHSDLES